MEPASPLRLARQARNWTLDEVVQIINDRSVDGSTGLNPSQISAWELGQRVTSVRYRKLLCDLYGQPAEALFLGQEELRSRRRFEPESTAVAVLDGRRSLLTGMLDVIAGAEEILVATGSRAHDPTYLDAVQKAVAGRPELVHYRVLFGPPRHPALLAHLKRLIAICNPKNNPAGGRRLHLGICDDDREAPERFFLASENAAVAIVPSWNGAGEFDTAIALTGRRADGLVRHAREAYAGARRLHTLADLQKLVPDRE